MYLKWVSNNLHCQIVISQVHVQANDESWNIYMKWEISSLIFLVNPLPYCSQQNVGAKFNVLSFSHYVAASTGNGKWILTIDVLCFQVSLQQIHDSGPTSRPGCGVGICIWCSSECFLSFTYDSSFVSTGFSWL